MPFYMTGRYPASRACNYLQNAVAMTYKKFLQFYAKRSCKKHTSDMCSKEYIIQRRNITFQSRGSLEKDQKITRIG